MKIYNLQHVEYAEIAILKTIKLLDQYITKLKKITNKVILDKP